MTYSLDTLPFRNSFAALPGDFYARVAPTAFETPARLIHFNTQAAQLLDLDPAVRHDPRCADVFSGKYALPGADPIAIMKAVKNPAEIAGARAAQARDGAAMVRFLAWFDREAPKGELIRRFRETEGSVLFATASFWEGVDVPGRALRALVINKLPFKVPSEPLTAARLERQGFRSRHHEEYGCWPLADHVRDHG